jgi:long-chain acyl-CoA synthetase
MARIAEMIRSSVERHREKPAVIDLTVTPARIMRYDEIYSGACRVASRLVESGLEPGSRVALSGANSPHWVAACLGIHFAGATVSPVDPETSDRDLAAMLEIFEPEAVICDRSLAWRFSGNSPRLIELDAVEFGENSPPFEPVSLAAEQPFSIIFTSGTTGRPKGVMLSEDNFLHNIKSLIGDQGLICEKDRVLNLLPLHHVYPFTATLLTPLCAGATVIYPHSLKSEDIMKAASEQEATIMAVVPQVLNGLHSRIFSTVLDKSLLARAGFKTLLRIGRLGTGLGCRHGRFVFRPLHRRLPKLRYFACGGARLEPEVHHDLASLGFRIVEAYGLSETSPVVAINGFRRPVPGSVGKPIPNVRVKAERIDPAVDDGEILVCGPNVMMGYYKDSQTTKEAFREGWFRTGDLGYLDKRGYLFLTGRLKEIIVMPSGKNITPQALEEHYGACELAEEVCICSIKDDTGDHLTAVVVPSREALMRKQTTRIYEDIKFQIENLSLQLPGYQRVTRVEILEQPLPKTRLGKLKRFEIVESVSKRSKPDIEPASTEAAEPEDPLLAFVKRYLKLKRNPRGTDNLETDLSLDSLAKLEFISAAEQHFGVEISEVEAGAVLCLNDLRPMLKPLATGKTAIAKPNGKSVIKPVEKVVELGESYFGRAFRLWAHLKLWFWFKLLFRIRIKGLKHLPAQGPYIIAPNHVSYIDGPVMAGILPYRVARRLFFLGIGDIFERFPFSLLRYRCRIIATGRVGSTAQSLQYCLEVLKRGRVLCMFPEGKRSIDKKADTPKPGVAILSIAGSAPIVPVHIRGTGATLSRTRPGFHLSRIEIEILPPIEQQDSQEEILARWHQLMRERDHLV